MIISSRFEFTILAILILAASLIAGCSSGNEATPTLVTTPTPIKVDSATPELSSWEGNQVVQTKYGAAKGFEDASDTWVWKAIPFAKPPVGELRWKAPHDPEPWEGIREETKFCSACPQYNPITRESIIGSEDCLYLNIWRPQSKETGLPVYVWIHGGGNSIGSANHTPTYWGSTIANKSNMLFVSMNYRLGPLGWFTHPALRTGNAVDDSGNYGTLDLIQALKWIHENIEAFGGDPSNVVITGESAGGINVCSLILSPLADGLFHKGLVESGMTVSAPSADGESSAQDVLMMLLINDGIASDTSEAKANLESMSNTEVQAYLRSKKPEEIFACYETKEFGLITLPQIFEDGTVIVSDGVVAFDTGTYPNKVPLIIGSNKEELKMFLFSESGIVGKPDLYQTVTSYGSDLWKVNGVDDLIRKLSSYPDQPDIYAYQFNWGAWKEDGSSPIPAPHDLTLGAAHSLDVPFFLGNPSFNVIMTDWVFSEENRPGREALTNAMMAYVAQFTRTGNPNMPGSGLPDWKPWTNGENEPKCILFDADLDNAKIKMSNEELTTSGVLQAMKLEVPEPLYSQAIEYILSQWTISHLLEDMEVDYTPKSTQEPNTSSGPTTIPKPVETAKSEAGIAIYNVSYENEGTTTEDTAWTMTITGEETIDGIECRITEITFDTNPERFSYIDYLDADIPVTITGMTTWAKKNTFQPIKAVSVITSVMNSTVTTTTTFTYDGNGGGPFSEGKTWSYEMVSTPSMGLPMTSTWTAQVVGIEKMTIPAGTFDCYKVEHISNSGDINIEWWANIDDSYVAVKMEDEANWTGIETRELVSYVGLD